MNKNINLCEILKGHEGKTFYQPLLGNITFKSADGGLVFFNYGRSVIDIPYHGLDNDGNMSLFPSKDQRDWHKWDKENNHKTPKTWSELVRSGRGDIIGVNCFYTHSPGTLYKSPIEKAAIAFIKIHQLIKVGYGGNVTNEEWNNHEIKYVINYANNTFVINSVVTTRNHLAFHTLEQAEEFLSYVENLQLLKDYYMV